MNNDSWREISARRDHTERDICAYNKNAVPIDHPQRRRIAVDHRIAELQLEKDLKEVWEE